VQDHRERWSLPSKRCSIKLTWLEHWKTHTPVATGHHRTNQHLFRKQTQECDRAVARGRRSAQTFLKFALRMDQVDTCVLGFVSFSTDPLQWIENPLKRRRLEANVWCGWFRIRPVARREREPMRKGAGVTRDLGVYFNRRRMTFGFE
jgi:hypothetical protein